MKVIKEVLKDLEFLPKENKNEYVSQSEIYLFILKAVGFDIERVTYKDYYTLLAAAAISSELIRQDQYGVASFEEETIYNLLLDRDDDEYKAIFEYIFGKQTYLEHHNINKIDMFFGENLKVEYRLLINIFAKIITADLNLSLEKVKKKLLTKVSIIEWTDLIIGGNGNYIEIEIEIERMESIVNGVLR
jgi:hypothetical protein